MLDEPTAALDDANAEKLISYVKSYCANNDMTLIVVCHNKALAEKFTDALILLEKTHGGTHERNT
jgi:putative ABC transport system ATP-binding protein